MDKILPPPRPSECDEIDYIAERNRIYDLWGSLSPVQVRLTVEWVRLKAKRVRFVKED